MFEAAVSFKGGWSGYPIPEPLAAQPSSLLPQAGCEAIATAAEYRKLAEECFKWAREAVYASTTPSWARFGWSALRGLNFDLAESHRQN